MRTLRLLLAATFFGVAFATVHNIASAFDVAALVLNSGDTVKFTVPTLHYDNTANCVSDGGQFYQSDPNTFTIGGLSDIIIDGQGCALILDFTCTELSAQPFFNITSSARVTIRNFAIYGAQDVGYSTADTAVFLVRASDVVLENIQVYNRTRAVLVWDRCGSVQVNDTRVQQMPFSVNVGSGPPSHVVMRNFDVRGVTTSVSVEGAALTVYGVSTPSPGTIVTWDGGEAMDLKIQKYSNRGLNLLTGIAISTINCTFNLRNVLVARAKPDSDGGGALHCNTGAISLVATLATFDGVTIQDCDIATACADSGNGGAIYVAGISLLNVTRTVISGNKATLNGGGIYVSNIDPCPPASSNPNLRYRANYADYNNLCDTGSNSLPTPLEIGSPSVILDGVTFFGNVAGAAGALYIADAASVMMHDVTFFGNLATTPVAGALICMSAGSLEADGLLQAANNSHGATSGLVTDCAACGCCTPTGIDIVLDDCVPVAGTTCGYSCDYGYQVTTADSLLHCSLEGEQTPTSAAACTLMTCSGFQIPGGSALPSTNYHASTSTLQCEVGYTLVGSGQIDCLAGVWVNNDNSYCSPLACGVLTAPPNGFVGAGLQTTTGNYTDVVAYSCASGYTLSGALSSRCGVDADKNPTWQFTAGASAPTCTVTTCDTRSVTYSTDCATTVPIRTLCTFTCNAGYAAASGTAAVLSAPCAQTIASAAGNWNSTLPLCAACNEGEYSNAGSTSCSDCINGYTDGPAANSSSLCLCTPGFFLAVPGSGECVVCPDGAVCEGRLTPPVAAPGYIQSAGAFIKCAPTVACSGNNVCAPGYTGMYCGDCDAGFYRLNNRCSACERNTGANLAVALVLGIFLALALAWLAWPNTYGGKPHALAMPHVFLFVVQIISIFQDVRFEWSVYVRGLFSVFSALNFNIDLLNLECVFADFNFYSRFYFYLSLPLIGLALFILLFLLRLALNKCMSINALTTRDTFHFALGGYLFFLSAAYLSVTRMTMAFFACFEQADGSAILSLSPGTLCHTAEYNNAYAYAVFGMVVYVFGIPAGVYAWYRVLQRRTSHEAALSHATLHSYAGRHTLSYGLWEATVFLRKFLVCLFLSLFAEQPVLDAVLCGATLFLACLATTVARPLVHVAANRVESLALVMGFAVLFAGLIAAPVSVGDATREAIGIIILIMIIAVMLVVLGYMLVEAREYFSLYRHWNSGMHQVDSIQTSVAQPPRFIVPLAGEAAVVGADGAAQTTGFRLEADLGGVVACASVDSGRFVALTSNQLVLYESAMENKNACDVEEHGGLLAASPAFAVVHSEGKLVFFSISSKNSLKNVHAVGIDATPTALHVAGITAFAGFEDGSLMKATAASDSAVTLVHPGVGRIMALATTDNLVFAGGDSGNIAVINVTTNAVEAQLSGHYAAVTRLYATHDVLLSTGQDNTWRVWNHRAHALSATMRVTGNGVLLTASEPTSNSANHKKKRAAGSSASSGSEAAVDEAGAISVFVTSSRGAVEQWSLHNEALALNHKTGTYCCRGGVRSDIAYHAVSARMLAGEDDAAFWDVTEHKLATAMSANLTKGLGARLPARDMYRFTHVSGHVDLTGDIPVPMHVAPVHTPPHTPSGSLSDGDS